MKTISSLIMILSVPVFASNSQSQLYKKVKANSKSQCQVFMSGGNPINYKEMKKPIKKSSMSHERSLINLDSSPREMARLVSPQNAGRLFSEVKNKILWEQYDLTVKADVKRLSSNIDKLLKISSDTKRSIEAKEITEEEARRYFRVGGDMKTDLKNTKNIIKLYQILELERLDVNNLTTKQRKFQRDILDKFENKMSISAFRTELLNQISFALGGVNSNARPPLDNKKTITSGITFPFIHYFKTVGSRPAKETLDVDSNGNQVENFMWRNRKTDVDFFGFGRKKGANWKRIQEEFEIEYLEGKTGYGTRPGLRAIIKDVKKLLESRRIVDQIQLEKLIELSGLSKKKIKRRINKDGHLELKIRIANEANSGPLYSRIYYDLGYHVNTIDHLNAPLRIKYDKKILIEWNSRKDFGFEIHPLGLFKLFKINRQKFHEQFGAESNIIGAIIIVNGREVQVTREELRNLVLKEFEVMGDKYQNQILGKKFGGQKNLAGETASNFKRNVEFKIKELLISPVSIQLLDPRLDTPGRARFDTVDLTKSTAARQVAFFAALFNNNDIRIENTRSGKYKHKDGSLETMFILSDVGSGGGSSAGYLPTLWGGKSYDHHVNSLDWTFVKKIDRDNNQIFFENFRPNVHDPLYHSLTLKDAERALRKLSPILRNNLKQHLYASGYHSTSALLYYEKIASRFNDAVYKLGLEGQVRLIPRMMDGKNFNWDSRSSEFALVGLGADGHYRHFAHDQYVVENGNLVFRDPNLMMSLDTFISRPEDARP